MAGRTRPEDGVTSAIHDFADTAKKRDARHKAGIAVSAIGGSMIDCRIKGPAMIGRRYACVLSLTATPLSLSSCCNSLAWNISRTMSQPPTNSPLT